jgi:hypothetical protein
MEIDEVASVGQGFKQIDTPGFFFTQVASKTTHPFTKKTKLN